MNTDSRFARHPLVASIIATVLLALAPARGGVDPASAGVPSDPPLVTSLQSPSGPSSDLMPQLPADKNFMGDGLLTGSNNGSSGSLGFQYSLHLLLRMAYDDNITLARTNRMSDWFLGIHPLLMFGVGDLKEKKKPYIRVDYMPNIFRYFTHTEANTVEHLLHLQAGFTDHDLTLTLNQDIQLLNAVNLEAVEVGGPANFNVTALTQVNLYTTRLDAKYKATHDTYFTSAVAVNVVDSPQLISLRTDSASFYVNRECNSKLTLGVGLYGGRTEVDAPSPDQTFEQPSVRVSWNPSPSWQFSGLAAVEFRQFEQNGRDDHITPVADIGVTYLPVEGTQITLNANRTVSASTALTAEDFVSNSINMSLRQRVTRAVFLGVTGGYSHARYFPTSPDATNVDPDRTESYWTIQPSVDAILAHYLSVGVYYLHRVGESSVENAGFRNNQVGFRTSIKF